MEDLTSREFICLKRDVAVPREITHIEGTFIRPPALAQSVIVN